MPACLVQDRHGMHVWCELMREVLEEDPHRARVGARQSQGERVVGAGPAGRKQVHAGVALIDAATRAHATLLPDARGSPLLPHTGLVLAPDPTLEALAGMLSRKSL